MIKVDLTDVKRMEHDLKTFARKAYPFATKQTINSGAFAAQKTARQNIGIKFIERNKFTRQSIRVNQAKGLNVSRQAATVGSTADYMERQEFGGAKRKKGKHGVPLATSYSSGEGNAKPRRRLPRGPNKLQRLQLLRAKRRGANQKQKNLIAVKEAAKSSRKFVFLKMGDTKGIYKVIGGKRKPKVRKVHDLSNPVVSNAPNPWLKPAVDKTIPLMPGFYAAALRFQIKRNKIFRS